MGRKSLEDTEKFVAEKISHVLEYMDISNIVVVLSLDILIITDLGLQSIIGWRSHNFGNSS